MTSTNDILPLLGFQDQDSFLAALQKYYTAKGYPYNDHIVGIRTNNDYTDSFTDYIGVIGQDGVFLHSASTKPGSEKAGKGGAVLIPNYYPNLWTKGTTAWSGDPYLQQINPCVVKHDNSGGTSISEETPDEKGLFGINLHSWKGFGEYAKVYNLSEGCQVLQEGEELDLFPHIEAILTEGNVDYCLIDFSDLQAFLNQNS